MSTVDEIGKLSRTLENALRHIRGDAEWFSARNKDAVLSQIIEAQKALDSLQAVVAAGDELYKQVVEMFDLETRNGVLYVAYVHDAKDKYERTKADYERGAGE